MSVAWSSIRPRVPAHSLSRRWRPGHLAHRSRTLLTLAIETSCDDTCVAVLDKPPLKAAARLLFNRKITSDNRAFQGVHPLTSVISHTASLGPLIQQALGSLPEAPAVQIGGFGVWKKLIWVDGVVRQKPDFVTVTRGPGMSSNLATGLNTAKGLAAAWDVPLLGVNHMQAHALTPRLVSALEEGKKQEEQYWRPAVAKKTGQHPEAQKPAYPFLSLLVSGGHTLLVHSKSCTDHQILAEAMNIAIGDMIDKCARTIVPASVLAGVNNVMYGALLEEFAFPEIRGPEDYDYAPPPTRADEIKNFDSGRGWTLTPPLSGTSVMAYDFAGFNSQVQRTVVANPDMSLDDRRFLAKHAMRLAFEHLASRLLFALKNNLDCKAINTVVISGGVASNKYLMHIMKSMLKVRGFGHVDIIAPPPALCTDNAAMLAWTGMEMYEAGWRSEMDVLVMPKWPVDPSTAGGGILGAPGWFNVKKGET
ncbi:putative Glycoprotease pgp1 [Seiridium cardinale]